MSSALEGLVPPVQYMAQNYTLDRLSSLGAVESSVAAAASSKAGYITAITDSGVADRPAYTVNTGGATIEGMLAATDQPIAVGDTVIVSQFRQQWVITGKLADGIKTFTPTLASGNAIPPPNSGGTSLGTGAAVGKYRMLTPSLMWVTFVVQIGGDGAIGTGSKYMIGGFPKKFSGGQPQQAVALTYEPRGIVGTRYPAVGLTYGESTWITDIHAGPSQSSNPLGPAVYPGSTGPGSGFQLNGTAVLEIDPLA